MTFTVTYRANDGALRDEVVEAADRAGCVAECRKRGIAPTKIVDGGRGKGRNKRGPRAGANGQDARPSSQRAGRPLSTWLVAALIVAVIAGGAWWWMARKGETETASAQQQGLKKPKAEKPARTASAEQRAPAATNAPPSVKPAPQSATAREAEEEQILTNIRENVPGRRTPRPTRIVKLGKIGKDGQPVEPPPPLFKSMGDNHIEQLVNFQPGERFLAIVEPAQIARDFKAHMDEPIEILPEDTPEQAERKRNYIRVRDLIVEDLRNGADLEEMIVEARRTLDKIAAMREEYMKALEEQRANGVSDDDLDDLATAASMLLKEHGANPILSPRQEDAEMTRRENESLNATGHTGNGQQKEN